MEGSEKSCHSPALFHWFPKTWSMVNALLEVQGHGTLSTPRPCSPEKQKPEVACRWAEAFLLPGPRVRSPASRRGRETTGGWLEEEQGTLLSWGSERGAGLVRKSYLQSPVALGLTEAGLWGLPALITSPAPVSSCLTGAGRGESRDSWRGWEGLDRNLEHTKTCTKAR